MHRGVWQATVHRVAQNWTGLKGLSTHARVYLRFFFFFPLLHTACMKTISWSNLEKIDYFLSEPTNRGNMATVVVMGKAFALCLSNQANLCLGPFWVV